MLEEVGLSARVAGMEKGLKTQLGKENGEGILLSGGEAQKAAIARALYKDCAGRHSRRTDSGAGSPGGSGNL